MIYYHELTIGFTTNFLFEKIFLYTSQKQNKKITGNFLKLQKLAKHAHIYHKILWFFLR